MKIEVLFSGIKNIENLYNVQMINSPFGKEEKMPQYEYIGKTYCENAITQVISKLSDVQEYKYEGQIERIAKEVFVIYSTIKQYMLTFTIDTYNYEKARMLISIACKKRENVAKEEKINRPKYTFSNGTEYDIVLEQVKITLKNVLKGDWSTCTWITDDQSEMLCSQLYPYVFKVENKIRAFANKVLVHNFGAGWLKQPGLEKYFASHKSLSIEFKRKVPCFSDIDDTFIAMTMEAMLEIILEAKIYENTIELTDEDCMAIHQKSADNSANSIMDLLRKKRKIKIDFWEDVFKKHFVSEAHTRKVISDFIKNRNHIAHNKLLNWAGYHTMFENILELDQIISHANTQFEESVPSEELYMTWDAEEEEQRQADAEVDWERNYIRMRIQGETGVSILYEDAIFDLFCQKLDELYAEIEDNYYFDPCYIISKQYSIEQTEEKQVLLIISSKAVEDSSIKIIVEMTLNGNMDGDSVATLICRKVENEEELFSANLHYHNGSGYEDTFEGVIMLDSESEYDDSQLDEFKKQLKDYVENSLNPLIENLDTLSYDAKRYGGPEPVADFPCYECDKNGVSIMAEFYPIGYCCYCGTDNEVSICERCGSVFEVGGGEKGFCNDCIVEIDVD